MLANQNGSNGLNFKNYNNLIFVNANIKEDSIHYTQKIVIIYPLSLSDLIIR